MADHPDYDPVIAKAWMDRRFKARLLTDPRMAVASLGITPLEGVSLRVVADTAETCCLVLPPPPPPPPGVSGREQLNRVAGGVSRAAVLLSNFSHIIETAWADPAFKALLLRDPPAALAEVGVTPPAGVRFTVTEDTDTACTLVVPPPPVDVEDPVEQAEDIANRIARWTALIAAPFAS